VNANPSGSRTASTGSRGGSEARREVATVAEPSSSPARVGCHWGRAPRHVGEVIGSSGGTRRAMMVRRGALITRRAAQGRVGDPEFPRHIARQLVPHRLLSANTSAPADAVRPRFLSGECPRIGTLVADLKRASRRAVQPGRFRAPRLLALEAELVHTRYDVTSTSGCDPSRGKGVLAA
jgi:hypothetical protein